jgi:hypothetical protein
MLTWRNELTRPGQIPVVYQLSTPPATTFDRPRCWTWDHEYSAAHGIAGYIRTEPAEHQNTTLTLDKIPLNQQNNVVTARGPLHPFHSPRDGIGTMATQQPAVPIIVGVGDVRNKSFKVEDAVEPAQLMVNAVRRAVDDSGLDHAAQESLLAQVDSLRVVPTWTWAYNDLPAVISHRLGIKPTRRVLGEHGGNQPALQCDEAARDIAARRSLVSVLTGGEALASRKSFPRLPPPKTRNRVC